MNNVQTSKETGLDPFLGMSALSAVTAIVLLLHPPQVPEFSWAPFSNMQSTIVQHVGEWRPHGPPPWMDVDQFTPEEMEEAPSISNGSAAQTGDGGPRSRPEL